MTPRAEIALSDKHIRRQLQLALAIEQAGDTMSLARVENGTWIANPAFSLGSLGLAICSA